MTDYAPSHFEEGREPGGAPGSGVICKGQVWTSTTRKDVSLRILYNPSCNVLCEKMPIGGLKMMHRQGFAKWCRIHQPVCVQTAVWGWPPEFRGTLARWEERNGAQQGIASGARYLQAPTVPVAPVQEA